MTLADLPQIDQDTIHAAIDDGLKNGGAISVYDGGEFTVTASTDKAEIVAALLTTDDDRLYFHPAADAKAYGWAWLVYGNEPGVVIADHTANDQTDAVLARANALMMAYDG